MIITKSIEKNKRTSKLLVKNTGKYTLNKTPKVLSSILNRSWNSKQTEIINQSSRQVG